MRTLLNWSRLWIQACMYTHKELPSVAMLWIYHMINVRLWISLPNNIKNCTVWIRTIWGTFLYDPDYGYSQRVALYWNVTSKHVLCIYHTMNVWISLPQNIGDHAIWIRTIRGPFLSDTDYGYSQRVALSKNVTSKHVLCIYHTVNVLIF